jgi:DNA damage-inducible protein 1
VLLYVTLFYWGHGVTYLLLLLRGCSCGVMRLLDKRFAGEARGVGSCKILGKVHVAQMKLGGSFFSVSLTVLENNDVCKLICILIVHFYEYM